MSKETINHEVQIYEHLPKFKLIDLDQSDSNYVLNIRSRVGATNGSVLVLVAQLTTT